MKAETIVNAADAVHAAHAQVSLVADGNLAAFDHEAVERELTGDPAKCRCDFPFLDQLSRSYEVTMQGRMQILDTDQQSCSVWTRWTLSVRLNFH